MDYIQEIYVINMKKSKDRLESITKQIDNCLDRSFTRIGAVNGRSLDTSIVKKYTTLKSRNMCSRGMIGCALSHYKTLKKFIATGSKYALILEDDCIFDDYFKETLSDSIKELNEKDPEWNFLYCGYYGMYNRKYEGLMKLLNYFGVLGSIKNKKDYKGKHTFIPLTPVGSYCYIISREGAKKILEKMNSKIEYPIDVLFIKSGLEGMYAMKHRIGYQSFTIEDSLVTDKVFPKTIQKYLDNNKYKLDDINVSFYLNSAVAEMVGITINGYVFSYMGLLILSKYLKIPSKYLFILIYSFLLIEYLLNPSEEILSTILFYILLFHITIHSKIFLTL